MYQESDKGSAQKYTKSTGMMYKELNNTSNFQEIIKQSSSKILNGSLIQNQAIEVLDSAKKNEDVMNVDNISWYLGLTLEDENTPSLKDRKTNFKNTLDVIINSGNVNFKTKLALYNHIKDAESDSNNPLRELCKMRGLISSGYGKTSTWQDSLKVIKESIVSDIQKNANLVTNSNKQKVKEVLQHHRRGGWHIRDHADSYNDNINIFENLERAIKKTAEASYCPKNEL
jgi:hypothetical protein